ncbi:MAG: hypothetical protein GY820_21200 [Gammaproteobacteria bacterium]|nr:hypothetical protein [Gammaproteobacteria bacterium]
MSKFLTHAEIATLVDYDYYPGEKQVLWPNDKAHPGCDDYIIINAVYYEGRQSADILSYYTCADKEKLEAEILEYERQPYHKRRINR